MEKKLSRAKIVVPFRWIMTDYIYAVFEPDMERRE